MLQSLGYWAALESQGAPSLVHVLYQGKKRLSHVIGNSDGLEALLRTDSQASLGRFGEMASRYFSRASVESERSGGTFGSGHVFFSTQLFATERIDTNSKAIKRAAHFTSLLARVLSRKYDEPNVITPPMTTPSNPKAGVRRSGFRYHGTGYSCAQS